MHHTVHTSMTNFNFTRAAWLLLMAQSSTSQPASPPSCNVPSSPLLPGGGLFIWPTNASMTSTRKCLDIILHMPSTVTPPHSSNTLCMSSPISQPPSFPTHPRCHRFTPGSVQQMRGTTSTPGSYSLTHVPTQCSGRLLSLARP